MRPWALHAWDGRACRASEQPVATFPEPRPGGEGQLVVLGEHALRVAPREHGWQLLSGARRLNGLRPLLDLELRHGDVLTVGHRALLVHDGRAPWPALPPEVEAAVVATRGSEASLAVYDDLLLDAGLDAAPASRLGLLHTLWGRGLEVDFVANLPARAALDLTAELTLPGLRHWLHALTTEPPFRFLRRLELAGPALTNPRASSGWLMELVLALEASPLPLLEEVGLSALFARANQAVLDRLARRVRRTEVRSRELPRAPDDDPGPDDVRLFRPPAPSSWFHGALPGEEPDEGPDEEA